jgi:hypothetical protein
MLVLWIVAAIMAMIIFVIKWEADVFMIHLLQAVIATLLVIRCAWVLQRFLVIHILTNAT